MTTFKLAVFFIAVALAPILASEANAQQRGRWIVTILPETSDGKPKECRVLSPVDNGSRIRISNSYREELAANPNYRGSAKVEILVNDTDLFSDDRKQIAGQKMRVPGREEWTRDVGWRKSNNGGVMTFFLEDFASSLASPIARGNAFEIDVAPDNGDPKTISVSLKGSWRAVLEWEKCVNS